MGVRKDLGHDIHDVRALEGQAESCDTSFSGTVTLETILLAWSIILLREQEDNPVSFEWQVIGCDSSTTHILKLGELGINLESTVHDAATKIASHLTGSVESCCVSSIVISTSTLSTTAPASREVLHAQVRLDLDRPSFRPVWHSDKFLPFNSTRYVQPAAEMASRCATEPLSTLRECLRPTPWDLDVIWSWNHQLPRTIDACMHDIITEQAQRLQDKVAISSWDGDLTYSQIDRWSTALAHRLRDSGVQHDDFVPLCFEKSRWAIVGVLAVMKAGATMVMMDPSIPLARLQNMAKQVKARVMLSSRLQSGFSESILPDGRRLVVDQASLESAVALQPDRSLEKVSPATLMYIIFTSGSTGTPKGVKVSHRSYTSSAFPRAQAVGYKQTSRVLDFAAYAFDVSIDSMLLTVANGGCLCIPSDEDRMNDINNVMRRMRINYAGITPSVARILEPDVIKSLTHGLGLGGEAAAASDVTRWGQDARIVIGYGPCECTIGCTINSSAATGRDYVSIGQGNGAAMWIVDPNDHNILLPVGSVGELLVEGPIVGQGYLDDPEKTAAAFIEDPTWLVAGHKSYAGRSNRLYKTGDLGRYDPDGSGGIVFAGRKDTQVKLRGQRVELGEIESQLRDRLPADTNVIAEVIKPKCAGNQPTLVAFILLNATAARGLTNIEATPLEGKTRDVIASANAVVAKSLPRYMVPTAYIPVTCIPTLISGKTDRKKLREFGVDADLPALDRAEPVNGSEEVSEQADCIRKAWAQILSVDAAKIRPDDNFFALGGDSVAGMKLVSLCRSLGLEITVTDLLTQSTLSALSSVARKCETAAQTEQVPFSTITRSVGDAVREAAGVCDVFETAIEDIYPCTPTQESLITFSLKSEESYIAQRVARIPRRIPIDTWMSAWEAVVATHPILRTRVAQLSEPGFQQVVLKQRVPWRHSCDLKAYLDSDRSQRMNLGEPLARYAVVDNRADNRWYMVWTVHHVLYDGWSEPLLLQKIAAHIRGQSCPLDAPIKDFVNFVRTTDEAAMASFWRNELRGAVGPQYPKLPSRDYFPVPTGMVERSIAFSLPRGTPFTIATVLRGAWALVASKHTGSEDIVFGETLTGRDISLPGAESIIGPLIATVPMRIQVSRSLTVESYLRSVQEGVSSRVPWQHMGMQNIRKVSQDAQIACETGTGIVIQPEDEYTDTKLGFSKGDVVHEALHFNPYPVMLGFGIRKEGFRVCASFDTQLVSETEMERVLAQLETTVVRLVSDLTQELGDVSVLPPRELDEICTLSNTIRPVAGAPTIHADDAGSVSRTCKQWVCDLRNSAQLTPLGCVGELWIEDNSIPGSSTEVPAWLSATNSLGCGVAGTLRPTGKLVRREADGALTFVRQKGKAVSIQGHEVDLAEIDVILRKYMPDNSPAHVALYGGEEDLSIVIVAQNGRDADQLPLIQAPMALAATGIIPATVITDTVAKDVASGLYEVEKAIKRSLPSYMAPTAYLVLQSIPSPLEDSCQALTELVSQLSRDQLLAIGSSWSAVWKSISASASLTDNERLLRSFWSTILKIDDSQIQPEDNFFRLGGDSVLGMKLVSSLRAAGHALSVADIFQHMRLADMAKRLKVGKAAKAKALPYAPFMSLHRDIDTVMAKTIRPQLADRTWTVQDAGPVTDAQLMDVQATVSEPRTAVQYTMLYMPAAVDSVRLLKACHDLVRSHWILRTVFVRDSEQVLQVVLQDADVPVVTRQTSHDLKSYVSNLAYEDITTELAYGTVFTKFLHVAHDSGEQCLVIRLSHAQYDGVSFPLMLQDLSVLYSGGQVSSSPSLLSYIASSLDKTVRRGALSYWTELLASAAPAALTQSARPVFLSAPITGAIPAGVTEGTLLSAAWAMALSRHLGKKDLLFGLVSAGRSLPASEDIRGPTYTIMPVRVTVGEQSSSVLLSNVAAQISRSAEHDHIGFSAIAAELGWKDASLRSMVHVQDVDEAVEETMDFAGATVGVDAVSPAGEAGGMVKAVSFRRNGQLCVGVVADNEAAEILLELFRTAVQELVYV